MDIYVTSPRALDARFAAALPLLPEERRAAVGKLHRREDALRSLAAGLLLRRFVGCGPFALGEHGKPFCPGGPAFSLAHGGALAVLAVAETEVGVDVERAARPYGDALCRRVLLGEEQRWLETRPREDFLTLWTRKEAVMKGCGLGLSLSPAAFSVLEDAVSLPGIGTFALDTIRYEDHFISAACLGGKAVIRLRPVGAEELLFL